MKVGLYVNFAVNPPVHPAMDSAAEDTQTHSPKLIWWFHEANEGGPFALPQWISSGKATPWIFSIVL